MNSEPYELPPRYESLRGQRSFLTKRGTVRRRRESRRALGGHGKQARQKSKRKR